mmetsp:Transcript_20586/g.42530  ORF Transcript_20586/g.42530 Transcript_20586/m.42530 type:complete len:96 (+) Transcript_20586:1432-1719(+)
MLGYSDGLVITLFEELVNRPTLGKMEGVDDCCSAIDVGKIIGIELLILFSMGIDNIVGVSVAIKKLAEVKKVGEDVEEGEDMGREMGKEVGEIVF